MSRAAAAAPAPQPGGSDHERELSRYRWGATTQAALGRLAHAESRRHRKRKQADPHALCPARGECRLFARRGGIK